MRLSARLAAVAVLFAALPAVAVPVPGLYEASVPVENQTPQAREPALRSALEAVVVRVIGSRDTAAAASVVARASALVQGYGYESATGGMHLRARFDPRAVDAGLRALGLPVWGANRLSYLAWIALRDDGGPRSLLDPGSASARAPALAATAEARGLPLSFPEMDAAERSLTGFDDVWRGNFTGIAGASQRYRSNLVLVGRVGRERGRWLGRWTLLDDGAGGEEWASSGETLEQALAAGIDELADRQALRFATQPGMARELRLLVTGVQSLEDYGRVLNYLRGLNPVRDAQVETAQGADLALRVRVEGDPDTLARVIDAGSVLRRESPEYGARERYVLVH